MMQTLADAVTVGRRFRRSMRIGADFEVADVKGFVCTATAAQALETTVDHVRDHGHGAFTWTGPYGCGKSTLAVILAAALGPESALRDEALRSLPEALRTRLLEAMRWESPGWTVIPIVGRRADPAVVLSEALGDQMAQENDPIEALLEASRSGPGP